MRNPAGRMHSGLNLLAHQEIEGEENFPIQVHSGACYFYYGNCYFYFSYLTLNCRSRANIKKHYINHAVNINPDNLAGPIMTGLLPNYTAMCNARLCG